MRVLSMVGVLSCVGAVLFGTNGCLGPSNECVMGTDQTHCDGNTLTYCSLVDETVGPTWQRYDCATKVETCVDTATDAYCADLTVKSALCPAKGSGSTCHGDGVLECHEGSIVVETPCFSDAPDCVAETGRAASAPFVAYCTKSRSQDPRCPASSDVTQLCDGATALQCRGGYVIWQLTCPETEVCTVSGAAPTRCQLKPTP